MGKVDVRRFAVFILCGQCGKLRMDHISSELFCYSTEDAKHHLSVSKFSVMVWMETGHG